MKKIKSFIALILALTFLAPTILIAACSKESAFGDSVNSSAYGSSNEISSSSHGSSWNEEDENENSSEQEDLEGSETHNSSPQETPPSSGNTSSGNTSSGNTSSGNTSSGNTSSGNTSSGNTSSGNTSSGNTSSGNTSSGNTSSGNTSSGNTSSNGSSEKEEPEESAPPTTTYAQYIRCTGDNVNIRAGAGTNYTVLGSAEKGTMYAVIGKSGNWYKTYYKNKTAYVYAEYASVFTLQKSKGSDVESVIEEGYKLLGVPYVYGAVRLHDGKGKLLAGFTAQKFDCSSLIQYVFYKGADVLLDVNTRSQVVQGKYVKPSNLQRGDCIYFTNESRQHLTGIERVGHVALYLGNDYILHTSSDYARIEKMTSTRWNYYIEARRFL